MISSIWTGFTGLDTFGKDLDVIGNNVANVGTTGFKYERSNFADILDGAQRTKQNVAASVTGAGSMVQSFQTVFLEGPPFANGQRHGPRY